MYDDRVSYQDVREWGKIHNVKSIVLVQPGSINRGDVKVELLVLETEPQHKQQRKQRVVTEIPRSKLVEFLKGPYAALKKEEEEHGVRAPIAPPASEVQIVVSEKMGKQKKVLQDVAAKKFMETYNRIFGASKVIATDLSLKTINEIIHAIQSSDESKTIEVCAQDVKKKNLAKLVREQKAKKAAICVYSIPEDKAVFFTM